MSRGSDVMPATVRDAMSMDVVTISCHASVDTAERLLVQHALDELFVTNEQGHLIGTLPDYAVLKHRMADVVSSESTVESLMSRRFLVIAADAPLTVALRYLREHVHHRLAVVEDMRLVGRVTRKAVLRILSGTEAGISRQTSEPRIPRPKMSPASRGSSNLAVASDTMNG